MQTRPPAVLIHRAVLHEPQRVLGPVAPLPHTLTSRRVWVGPGNLGCN